MSDWWEQIEHALVEDSEDAPDPWAALADDPATPADGGLTAEQKAFLQQLAEQPQFGRFDDDID